MNGLKCSSCQQTAYTVYAKGPNFDPLCKECYVSPPSRVNVGVQISLKGGTIGAAHLDDITHRKLNPDGSVTRDTGRKSIRVR